MRRIEGFGGRACLTKEEAWDVVATLVKAADVLREARRPEWAFALEGVEALVMERPTGAGPDEGA